jgi:3-phenylpropionate/cinnamic acid dioxygenase small subunit
MTLLHDVEALLYLEARLLDERRFRAWLDLYTQTCTYWLPARWGQTGPVEEVSLIYDDRMTLEARIGRLEHPRAHAQLPPSRTVHAVTNIRIAGQDDDAVTVQSVCQFNEFRAPDLTQLVGLQEHRLVATESGLRIAAKRVDLLTCDQPLRSLQIPI